MMKFSPHRHTMKSNAWADKPKVGRPMISPCKELIHGGQPNAGFVIQRGTPSFSALLAIK